MLEKNQSLFYLKIFFILVILLIFFSIILKVIYTISSSTFKNNSFSVLYISKESKIIFVDKKERKVTFLSVGNISNFIKGKSPFIASIALGVPVNGIIYDDNKNLNPTFGEFINFNNEIRLVTELKSTWKNMNIYDLHKVMSIARNANKENTRIINVNLLDEKSVKENISDSLSDSEIRDSKYTVEIVNGTNVNGLASSLASVLVKLGYNVVFLQTVSGTYKDDSYLGYVIKPNIFIKSLQMLTNLSEKNKTITESADVTIYLGSDLESQFND